jgi:uroporphyrinogen-III synthase
MLDANLTGPVLFFCGDRRRDELSKELRNFGIEVDEVVCYRSVLADESTARAVAARGRVLVVASPSVVDLLVRSCAKPYQAELLAVGPTTAAKARALGWVPAAVAHEPTVGALASALRGMLANR